MAKKIVGKAYRKEGQFERLNTAIKCLECGHTTYERKAKKIQHALTRDCSQCKQIQAKKKADAERLQTSTHFDGRRKHPLIGSYSLMIQRCYNPDNPAFLHYGGRGIYICTRWLVDFWAFVEDMGPRPEGYSIDRIDNDGPYDPRNCKWSSPLEQAHNKRKRFTLLTPKEKKLRDIALQQIQNVRRLYSRKLLGWWRENFGLYNNPYIYGPMPWKRTSHKHRKAEATQMGWYIPRKVK